MCSKYHYDRAGVDNCQQSLISSGLVRHKLVSKKLFTGVLFYVAKDSRGIVKTLCQLHLCHNVIQPGHGLVFVSRKVAVH